MAPSLDRRNHQLAYCSCAADLRPRRLFLLLLTVMTSLTRDVAALFRQIEYDFAEEQPVGTTVGRIPDDVRRLFPAENQHPAGHWLHRQHQQQLYQFRYVLRASNHYFRLDELTGWITCIRVVDRELICPPYSSNAETGCDRIVLDVTVRPQLTETPGTASGSAAAFNVVAEHLQLIKVVVTIIDVNDHSPAFPQDWEVIELIESTAVGTTFALPEAEDSDGEPLSIQSYRMESADNVDTTDTFQLVTSRQVV